MKKGTIQSASGIILNFAPNQEAEVIEFEGKLFIEFQTVTIQGVEKDLPPGSAMTERKAPVEQKLAKTADFEVLTEEDMMSMEVAELTVICKQRGIEIPDDGKRNTNAKVRKLILAWQEENEGGAPATPAKSSAAPAESSGPDLKKVTNVFTRLDSGSVKAKVAVEELVDLGVDESAAKNAVQRFADDDKLTAGEMANELCGGEETSSAAPKAKAKGKKIETVEIEDLQKGDEITAYWEDLEEDWNGTVTSTRGGVVSVKWSDGDTSELDPDNHTNIRLGHHAEA